MKAMKQIDPPTPAPVVRCRCCGKEMLTIFQPGLLPHHKGYWLVTCPEEDRTKCILGKQTLEATKYPSRDLTSYGFDQAGHHQTN